MLVSLYRRLIRSIYLSSLFSRAVVSYYNINTKTRKGLRDIVEIFLGYSTLSTSNKDFLYKC